MQEAEIVKMFRILIGVDDNDPQRLRVMPRLPHGWTEIAVAKYPALIERDGKLQTAQLHYDLRRAAGPSDDGDFRGPAAWLRGDSAGTV